MECHNDKFLEVNSGYYGYNPGRPDTCPSNI